MMATLGRVFLSGLLLGIAVLFLTLSMSLGPTARLVPMAVAIPTLVLLLIQFCFDLFPKSSETADHYLHLRLHGVEKLRAQSGLPKSRADKALGLALAWFAVAPLLIILLGFLLATPLYTIAFLRFHAREGWPKSIEIGTAISAVISVLLLVAVGAPAVDGWLIGQLLQ